MPDLSVLVELAEFYHVDIKEIIDGERKSEIMNEETRETLFKVAEYTAEDKMAEKQAKQAAKDKAALEKFGLDFENYSLEEIRNRNISSSKEIASSLAGSKLYSFGSLLSGNSNETFALELARAQVEQNFILMRQNEEIIRLLKELTQK